MVPLSPFLLIATAQAFVGQGADSETRRGRLVRSMCDRVGDPKAERWSAAFVHHAGYWSHYGVRGGSSSWPLPATNDPHELEQFAQESDIFAIEPRAGDVFLHWSPTRQ